ncbi:MAG: B12-binding domain-containing radical SAM protein, partial [Epsilonproteobacteria bacterium]|nr:B12-binding domain-containing radical SAM protein [Campylobacterota bacterium]
LAELVFRYLCEEQGYEKEKIKAQLIEDIMTVRGRKMPSFLRDNYVPRESEENTIKVNKRQLKHANAV